MKNEKLFYPVFQIGENNRNVKNDFIHPGK